MKTKKTPDNFWKPIDATNAAEDTTNLVAKVLLEANRLQCMSRDSAPEPRHFTTLLSLIQNTLASAEHVQELQRLFLGQKAA